MVCAFHKKPNKSTDGDWLDLKITLNFLNQKTNNDS